MSLDSIRIRCTGCNFSTQDTFVPIELFYRLPDGTEFKTGRTKGWCYRCENYSDIENMDAERLQAEVTADTQRRSEFENRLGTLKKLFLGMLRNAAERGTLASEIGYLEHAIIRNKALWEIARQRKARSRCLRCWSEETAPATFDDVEKITKDFQHKCGGRLKIVPDPNGMRVHYNLTTLVLTIEGQLLERR